MNLHLKIPQDLHNELKIFPEEKINFFKLLHRTKKKI